MDNALAISIVENAAAELGYDRISPESLEAIAEDLRRDSFDRVVSAYNIRAAYNVVMAGFRALFAPA